MKDFQRGDRVKVTKDYDLAEEGMTGIILGQEIDGMRKAIEFDEYMMGHVCEGLCKHGYGQYVPSSHLKLLPKGGKKMKEKKYTKGKKVYIQFNCPENDDDFSITASLDPSDLDENLPFAECIVGDLKEIVVTKSMRKVKD